MKNLSKVFLILFIYIVTGKTFAAINTAPFEGDSLAYHIPISQMLMKGDFMNPEMYGVLHYYPSNGELILGLLESIHVHLNLFNVIGTILLFLLAKKLAEIYGFKKSYATIFAVTVSTLNIVVRWMDTQVIDVWLTVFFLATLVLLALPKDNYIYYLKLGVTTGLLVGVKYTGPIYAVSLFLLYFGKFKKYLNIHRLFIFLLFLIILGASWYLRNIYLVGNPVYPQSVFIFQGTPGWDIFPSHTWQIVLSNPVKMMNAIYGEYGLLGASMAVPLIFLTSMRNKLDKEIVKISLLGTLCFVLYLFLYTSTNYQIMVSSLRYSIPAFVLFILVAFRIFESLNKQLTFVYMVLLSILPNLHFSYQPKIVLVILAVMFLYSYITNKKLADLTEEC